MIRRDLLLGLFFILAGLAFSMRCFAADSAARETPSESAPKAAPAPSSEVGKSPATEPAVNLDKVEVTAKREALFNSIDRKVYNVGKEIQSASGSASDLLQNIPSVQVDIEGNVSLRGNENVLILVDGKPSPLMSTRNRADVLAQMPADSIDRIEVITNPSAQYKPDGTAGIINITTKRKHDPGYSGVLRVNVGNDRRGNASLNANYSAGKFNVFGLASVRQDDRLRTADDQRSHLDDATGSWIFTEQVTTEHMRPLSRLFQGGVDYNINRQDKIGFSAAYNDRTFFRTSTINNLSRAADGSVTSDYDRLRADDEWQETVTFGATYSHSFAEEGRELKVEVKRDRHAEQEDNHYTNVYRTPATPVSYDYTVIRPIEASTVLSADYEQPLANEAKLETGYAGEANKNDSDFRGGLFDPVSGSATIDTAKTNRFVYKNAIHAVYATYGQALGSFGFLAGLRAEQTNIDTNQVTVHLKDKSDYFRLYPTLHLTYDLTEASQLQLNYSHRVHRPENDDLNPFPEYQDPYNLRAGNPKLQPEQTHSVETGYQYRHESTTYLATVYYRQTYHAFTTVTRYIDSTTLLTTQENLASNRAGGLELAATANLGPRLSFNASSNAFYSEVDASNLGFSGRRSAVAWEAKLNADWRLTRADLFQLNTNYRAKRLTAQGYRLPSFIASIGMRHEFKKKNTALVFTVADLFNSLKERTVIDTPVLHENITRRRSSRIYYAGLSYDFGKPTKKPKNEMLKVDESL